MQRLPTTYDCEKKKRKEKKKKAVDQRARSFSVCCGANFVQRLPAAYDGEDPRRAV